jgi:lipopolysaccharide/colanic/teichoic acid biosynthesis glycosyltransferase
MSLVQLFVGDALLPRFVVFGTALLLPDWYRLCVGFSAGGRARAEARDRVAVIANDSELAALDCELRASPERPASIVLRLTVHDACTRDLGEELLIAQPAVIVLDREAQDQPGIVAGVAELHEQGVRVRTLSMFYEQWLGKLPVSELRRTSLLFDIADVHRARYGRSKRIADLVISAAGLLLLLLAIPAVALANRIANRGPLFYRQQRVGRGGIPFVIVKFRTMVPVTGEMAQGSWTALDDPRVTRVGRFLRVTHLDELPQMVNILKGDLSIVGPRPEQPQYVDQLSASLPFYGLRHLARPGLTGWAQVKHGYAGSEDDALEKLQYEFWYLRHQSLVTDARILGRTIRSVLGGFSAGR